MRVVKGFLASVIAISLVACIPSSKPPSTLVDTVASAAQALRAQLDLLLVSNKCFNDLVEEYGLEAQDTGGLNNVLYATSTTIPGLEFDFSNDYNSSLTDPQTFPLVGVSGPASLLLPEYVGMKFTNIPIFLEERGPNVQMQDDIAAYQITVADPQVLSADDSVYMQTVGS